MRVVTNQKKLRRNRKIAQYAFFITLGILVLGLFVVNAAPTNPLLFLSPIIVLPVAVGATLFSVRMANNWLREPRPEAVLKAGLKGLSSRATLYHYVLPANHVLVAPEGTFVFTFRAQDGDFVVNGDRWTKKGGVFSKFTAFFRQDMLGRPDLEAQRDAARLKALLDQAVPDNDVVIQPVVIFTSPRSNVEVIEASLPVLNADPKKKPNLKTLLRDTKKRQDLTTLNDRQVAALEVYLGITLSTADEADE